MKASAHRWLGALAIFTIAAFVAAGCGSGTSTSTGSSTGGLAADQTLNFNVKEDPQTLNPTDVNDIDSSNIVNSLFSGLNRMVGVSNTVKPALAESTDVSSDGMTITYHLRKDAKWTNGDPVTAQDFVYGWLHGLDPAKPSSFAYQMYDVVGACEYATGSKKPADALKNCGPDAKSKGTKEEVGVKAVDNSTLEVKLRHAVPWFDQLVTLPNFFPLPEKTITKFGAAWTDPANIVTDGPFKLKSWTHSQQMVLVKNDGYFDAGNVTLKTVNFLMVKDAQSAFAKFMQTPPLLDGGVNNSMISPGDIDQAKNDDRFYNVPSLSTQYLWLNTKTPSLSNAKVRAGIAFAINRKAITDNVLKSGQNPIATVLPPGMPGYDTIAAGEEHYIDPKADPDLNKAKQLLADGGWKPGTSITIYWTSAGPDAQAIVTSLQSDLAKVGVNLKLHVVPDGGAFYALATPPIKPEIDGMLLGWIADYADSYNFYNLFTCTSGLNVSQWCDAGYDKIVKDISTMRDDTERFKRAKDAEAMLTGPNGAFPAIPIYQDTDRTMIQPYVKGFEFTPGGIFDLSTVSIAAH